MKKQLHCYESDRKLLDRLVYVEYDNPLIDSHYADQFGVRTVDELAAFLDFNFSFFFYPKSFYLGEGNVSKLIVSAAHLVDAQSGKRICSKGILAVYYREARLEAERRKRDREFFWHHSGRSRYKSRHRRSRTLKRTRLRMAECPVEGEPGIRSKSLSSIIMAQNKYRSTENARNWKHYRKHQYK